jgi:hypothetical protein
MQSMIRHARARSVIFRMAIQGSTICSLMILGLMTQGVLIQVMPERLELDDPEMTKSTVNHHNLIRNNLILIWAEV